MKKTDQNHLTPDEDALLERDPVWDLLDQAPAAQAGPFFSRNVLREIRLSEAKSGFGGKLGRFFLSAKFALPALALVAAGAIWFPREDATVTTQSTPLQNYVEEEIILAAADDPELLSDEDLIALLF